MTRPHSSISRLRTIGTGLLVAALSATIVTATSPDASAAAYDPGNHVATVSVPAGMGLESVSKPDHVVGNGTSASCTSAAVVAAVKAGGVIVFRCGSAPKTIVLTQTLKVLNSTKKLVIDGGGKVALSGGGKHRILYIDTCDTSLGKVAGNCLYAPAYPAVTVQNVGLIDGNATSESYVSPGDTKHQANGGGAIFALGGRLKVVRAAFFRNRCATNGPDLGGGAIRVLAQHSPTPNNLDGSYAARGQYPATVVQSTLGSTHSGNSCSNGGAISSLRTPVTVINSVLRGNHAVGCCSNPAKPGTPGGGSGGAVYADGDTYTTTIAGSIVDLNTAKAGGRAIFYVSNDRTGHLVINSSTVHHNSWAASGQKTPQSFENYPNIFYLGNGKPVITKSTIA